MKEIGVLNRGLAKLLSEQGHQDMLMLVDAGFAIPKEVEVVDLSLRVNVPSLLEVIRVVKSSFSTEKLILAKETESVSPSLFNEILDQFDSLVDIETIDHIQLKEMSAKVKGIIRTGDFTAYGNVILVSGAGDRWYLENEH